MPTFLSTSRFPEMKSLSAKQCRFVQDECLYWLHHGPWFRFSTIATTFVTVLIGPYLVESYKLGFWPNVATLGTCVFALGYIHDILWLAHFRPQVARFMQMHEAEINAVA